jgi:crossover junction endodeoxyribonuclease RuvC
MPNQRVNASTNQHFNESINQRILGIDPGLTATGYAVIDAAAPDQPPLTIGEVRTTASDPLGARLRAIHDAIAAVATEHRSAFVSVESLFTRVNAKTALQMAQARGVALLGATAHGAALHEYAPAEIKRLVAGSGRADKAQMIAMVRVLISVKQENLSDHMADALAAAICHRQHLQLIAQGRATSRRPSKRATRRAWQEHVESRES